MSKKIGHKKRGAETPLNYLLIVNAYLTIAFNAFPALNFGTFFAGIAIFLPVAGFTPVRLFLFITEKVPNPVNTTFLFCLSALPIVEMNASKHSLQVAFGNLLNLAMLSTIFALFIKVPR